METYTINFEPSNPASVWQLKQRIQPEVLQVSILNSPLLLTSMKQSSRIWKAPIPNSLTSKKSMERKINPKDYDNPDFIQEIRELANKVNLVEKVWVYLLTDIQEYSPEFAEAVIDLNEACKSYINETYLNGFRL